MNDTVTPCILSNDSVCSHQVLLETEFNDTFSKKCDDECPFECDRVEFDYRISGNEVFNHELAIVYFKCLDIF